MNPIERAEIIQALKAYLIPSSLFVASLIMSAGIFLVYNGYALGCIFVGFGFFIIVSALIAFVRFQNRYRARGLMPEREDVPASPPPVVLDRSEDNVAAGSR